MHQLGKQGAVCATVRLGLDVVDADDRRQLFRQPLFDLQEPSSGRRVCSLHPTGLHTNHSRCLHSCVQCGHGPCQAILSVDANRNDLYCFLCDAKDHPHVIVRPLHLLCMVAVLQDPSRAAWCQHVAAAQTLLLPWRPLCHAPCHQSHSREQHPAAQRCHLD